MTQSTESGRILVVDDDRVNRLLLAKNLHLLGYAVDVAANGRQALEMMRAAAFDLVLLDLVMPEMDGFQVLEQIKADAELTHVPVVVISALDQMDAIVRCIEMGAADYLPKPSNPKLLQARIQSLLTAKRLRDKERAYLLEIRKLSQAVEFSSVSVIITDRQGVIQYVNPMFCQVTGFTAEEAVGKTPRIVKSNHHSVEFYRNLWQTILSGQPWQGELLNRKRDDTYYWEQVNISPIFDEGGQITHFVGVREDITRRKLAEDNLRILNEQLEIVIQERTQALQKSESHYRAVVDLISDFIFTGHFDPDGLLHLDWASANFEEISGYPFDQFVMDDIYTRLFAEDLNAFEKMVTELRSGKAQTGEIRLKQANGAIQWLKISARPLEGETGSSSKQLIGAASDVTERKTSEEVITKMLEERVAARTRDLTALYEVASLANERLEFAELLSRTLVRTVTAVDGLGGAIYLYDSVEQVFRLTARHLLEISQLGQVERLLFETERGAAYQIQPQVIELPGSETVEKPVCVAVPVQMRGRLMGVMVVLISNITGLQAEVVALLTGLADQIGNAVESEGLRSQAQAAAILEERQQLARNLHDTVSQSLFGLNLLTQAGRDFIEEGDMVNLNACFAELEQNALQSLKGMRLLLYELRGSTLEDEGIKPALELRLNTVERRAGIEAHFSAEGVDLLPGKVQAELYHVAMEALNNSLKYAAATRVWVKLKYQGDALSLEIRDNGQGFSTQNLVYTGMGLRNMEERAARLGVDLKIISKPGKGTRIILQGLMGKAG